MSEDPEEHTMTFWEHLEELRVRIIKMAIAFVICGGVAWFFKEPLLVWLTQPFVDAWNSGELGGKVALHFPAPQSLFIAYIKLSLLAGFIGSLPILLYQLWAFVAPGLYSNEKKLAIPFVVCSCLLFVVGGYFSWRIAAPIAFQYFLGFSGPVGLEGLEIKPTVMIGDYISFISRMFIAFGVVFELPMLVLFLSIAGIVDHTHLIKFSRYFIVVAFVLGAVITPPDPMSQVLLAVPLCVLYVISIGIAWLFHRRRASAEAAEEGAE